MKIFSLIILLIIQTTVFAADFTSRTKRQVQEVESSLKRAQGYYNGSPKDLSGAKHYLSSASEQLVEILKRGQQYKDHPQIISLQQQIKLLSQQVAAPTASPTPTKQANHVATNKDKTPTVVSTKMAQENKPAATGVKKLSSNIIKKIRVADEKLEEAKSNIANGLLGGSKIKDAQAGYKLIFDRYKSSFDADHPDILAFKERIDKTEASRIDAIRHKMATLPAEENNIILGMSEKAGLELRGIGRQINDFYKFSDKENARAQRSFENARGNFNEFKTEFSGQYKETNESFINIKTRLAKVINDHDSLNSRINKQSDDAAKAKQAQYNSQAKKIMSTYPNQALTSQLHKNNVGKIVWSNKAISTKEQDKAKIITTFKLSDSIFGRIYIPQSIGNTPIYSDLEDYKNDPKANTDFFYHVKFFVNGQQYDRFAKPTNDFFKLGSLPGQFGQSGTTWEFAPNPVGAKGAFKEEADGWRNISKKLEPGQYKIRFEVWAGIRLQSKAALAIGEFTLVKAKGERVAATGVYPKDNYAGSDNIDTIKKEMKRALGPVANNLHEIVVTSDWRHGVYVDTKVQHRTIAGTILYIDEDDKEKDGVCFFNTNYFRSNHLGGDKWTPLAYKSVCLGCPEGVTECPK